LEAAAKISVKGEEDYTLTVARTVKKKGLEDEQTGVGTKKNKDHREKGRV